MKKLMSFLILAVIVVSPLAFAEDMGNMGEIRSGGRYGETGYDENVPMPYGWPYL